MEQLSLFLLLLYWLYSYLFQIWCLLLTFFLSILIVSFSFYEVYCTYSPRLTLLATVSIFFFIFFLVSSSIFLSFSSNNVVSSPVDLQNTRKTIKRKSSICFFSKGFYIFFSYRLASVCIFISVLLRLDRLRLVEVDLDRHALRVCRHRNGRRDLQQHVTAQIRPRRRVPLSHECQQIVRRGRIG